MFQKQRLTDRIKNSIFRMDKMILSIVYALTTISTIFVYSATRENGMVIRNILWIAIGTILVFAIASIDYKILKLYIWHIYGIGAVLLLLVRFAGKKTLGAQRWIALGPFQLQPSEFVKVGIILIIAYWIVTKYREGINNLKDIIGSILPALPLILLILIQPDLGTTLITISSFLFMIFLYGADMKPIWVIGIVVLLSVYPVYRFVLDDYQRDRVETFLHPEKDRKGSGWHVIQSKISVGAGGIMGKGVLQGSQSRLEFLPEAQTDFIFSVLSEELGFVGSSLVLLLYFMLIYEIMRIARIIQDDFGRLILYGLAGVIFMHVIVNVGMTIGLVPVTGKPLLFMSYGGSSFLASFIMIGIIESIKIHNN
ncbi:rod shape-determining protein RodA [uncultured Leptotrichia sp.]|jgi:rod shape-determining protein rodA|uniref:rod shape-determining protein RodA n=1 Tax=uncultured Leptotrichia sp. TaxID=159271 RepID=UPI0026330E2A|nr:rod shape-determining protein RodA [uncultured Leptotrichia sp.]